MKQDRKVYVVQCGATIVYISAYRACAIKYIARKNDDRLFYYAEYR